MHIHTRLVIIDIGDDKSLFVSKCYNLKLELRLHLDKDLREDKGFVELVKHKDTVEYLHYIYY